MSDPTGYWAFGSELRIFDGADYIEISGVQSITGPGKTRTTIDYMTHKSAGGFMERVGGPRDSGTITCDIVWTADSGQRLLEEAYESNDSWPFQLLVGGIPEDNLHTFVGFIQSLEQTEPTDGLFTKALTLQISGPIDTTTE